MAVPISIKNIKPGWKLEEKIISEDGRVLVNAGVILTPELIKRLQHILIVEQKVPYYYVKVSIVNNNPEEEAKLKEQYKQEEEDRIRMMEQDFDITDFLGDIDKDIAIDAIRNSYRASEKDFSTSLSVVNDCVKKIVYQVQTNPNFSYSLGQYKKINNVEDHSFRVSQFAVVLANAYNKSVPKERQINLDTVGIAALLHDYGTRFKDPEEMKKLATHSFSQQFLNHYPKVDHNLLTKPYDDEYKTIYAYVALKDFIPNSALNMILYSDERENSNSVLSGNTEKLDSSSKIGAKIIAICSMYDLLLYKVIESDQSLENVSVVMDRLAMEKIINPQLQALFSDTIPLYSVGVRVQLSNGKYATVIERRKGPLAAWPIVRTLEVNKEQAEIIDLSDISSNVTIKRVVGSKEHLSKTIALITEGQLRTTNITVLDPNTRLR